jgi:hypothetical protein
MENKSEQSEVKIIKSENELSTTATAWTPDPGLDMKLTVTTDRKDGDVTIHEKDNTIEMHLTESFGGFLKTFDFSARSQFYDLDIYLALLRGSIIHTLNQEVAKHRGLKAFITLYPLYKEFKPNGQRVPGSLAAKPFVVTNKFEVLAGVARAFRELRILHEEFKPGTCCLCMDGITTAKLGTAQYNQRG